MASDGAYVSERSQNSIPVANSLPSASNAFFASDFQKHDDIRNMLESNKDSQKLEAMKRIIGMIAKGKDASELFPYVVKNVVSKKTEVKKLVYVYLVRYAEEQQDLALLSISSFQRSLKDPNQLIRASAVRVLSSIRITVIVPIMMLALKDAASDMSPYVRKTAAHAIPKLYSLDRDQRTHLVEVIERLLSDKTTLVIGSAVMAFEEVCPERIDLIHKNYRKLCALLADVEEWGQVVIIQMLTRYSRTQFVDPNKSECYDGQEEMPFYDSEEKHENEKQPKPYVMDPDHRLLLRNSKQLLQSRNAAVVMAVSQLYYYIAPKAELTIVAKALVRLLHSHREIQLIVLTNIATTSVKSRAIFVPYLKSFYVRSSDTTRIKIIKLDILANLASETNISVILREFQSYISSPDTEFVTATIKAIGRCGSTITEVTNTCLNGLVLLLSNSNKNVVAESVIVIKNLLQIQPGEHTNIIVHLAKMAESMAVPMARASILWLLGEYARHIPKIVPDVLRKFAKSFVNEDDIVKLQILNLASKLFLTNPKQTGLLVQYVFNLAKYDQNYDIRDRVRFLKQLIMPHSENKFLSKYAKKILLANKPAPVLQSKFQNRDRYQLGSLSHLLDVEASGYRNLPDFPDVPPDASTRNVEVPSLQNWLIEPKKQTESKSFYSETESSSTDESGSASEEDDYEDVSKTDSSRDDLSEDGSGEGETHSESSAEDSPHLTKKSSKNETGAKRKTHKSNTTSSSDSVDTSDDSSDENSEASSEEDKTKGKSPEITKVSSNLDLLLDLYSSPDPVPVLQAKPLPTNNQNEKGVLAICHPAYVPQTQHEVLNRFNGNGLVVTYRFTRSANLYSSKMTTIELTFRNEGDKHIKGISVLNKKVGNIDVKGFPALPPLAVNSYTVSTIGIDYNESTNPVKLKVCTEMQNFEVTIKPSFGELLEPVLMSENEFSNQQNKLRGMNECSAKIKLQGGNFRPEMITTRIQHAANMMQVSAVKGTANVVRFAGQTLNTKALLLVAIQILNTDEISIFVNCEKVIFATIFIKELKELFCK